GIHRALHFGLGRCLRFLLLLRLGQAAAALGEVPLGLGLGLQHLGHFRVVLGDLRTGLGQPLQVLGVLAQGPFLVLQVDLFLQDGVLILELALLLGGFFQLGLCLVQLALGLVLAF